MFCSLVAARAQRLVVVDTLGIRLPIDHPNIVASRMLAPAIGHLISALLRPCIAEAVIAVRTVISGSEFDLESLAFVADLLGWKRHFNLHIAPLGVINSVIDTLRQPPYNVNTKRTASTKIIIGYDRFHEETKPAR